MMLTKAELTVKMTHIQETTMQEYYEFASTLRRLAAEIPDEIVSQTLVIQANHYDAIAEAIEQDQIAEFMVQVNQTLAVAQSYSDHK